MLALALLLCWGPLESGAEPLTVFVPSQPGIERADPPQKTEKDRQRQDAAPKSGADVLPEVDILFSMMIPHRHAALDMDRPQMFAALVYPPNDSVETGADTPKRVDLLSDVEEIRYLDKKAWGANVALDTPGLYQFITDAKPWWDDEKKIFRQQHVKVMVPVLGVSNGWNIPAGQIFEIQPLTRPFGLAAPAFFSGRVLLDGKPYADAQVYMGRINTGNEANPTHWHSRLEAVCDASGQFGFVLNQPGWWYCEAVKPGAPLKGADGEMKPVERAAILWLYVDPPAGEKGKR